MLNPSARSARLHRILVVDDDPETLRMMRNWYRGRPFEIVGALKGEDGLNLASSRQPDLVLLDLKMPDVDGITVAKRLKQDPFTRGIPIILLSACRDIGSKVEAFGAGADDYVTKPFEFEEIDARIETNLRRRADLLAAQERNRELSAANEDLERSLQIDEKTGLANFRELQRRLKDEWQRATRYSTPLSLLFFDIDHFKQINDRLGHQTGDRVLKEFGTLVTGGARANDVAARFGGEEFAVILPHTDGEMAVHVAERIRVAVQEFVFAADETPTRATVSAGVATYPGTPGVDSVEALVRAADMALYQAKEHGRNVVVLDGKACSETPGAARGRPSSVR